MKSNDIKQCDLEITSITENLNIINNRTTQVVKHKTNSNLILSKISKDPDNNAPGYFNNITRFVIGDRNSIMVISNNGQLLTKNTSDIKNTDFMIYQTPISSLLIDQNYFCYIDGIKNELDFKTGYKIMSNLIEGVSDKYNYKNKKNFYDIDCRIIVNSNLGFLTGMCSRLNECKGEMPNNLNRSTIRYIFNSLGASYSIYCNGEKFRYKLPYKCSVFSNNINYRSHIWILNNNVPKKIKTLDISKYITDSTTDFELKILNEEMTLIPFKYFKLINTNTEEILYDLSSDNIDSTNYMIPFTPLLKNSDGDVLALTALHTEEGINDSLEFSPDSDSYFLSTNTGEFEMWLQHDSLLGLYNLTNN